MIYALLAIASVMAVSCLFGYAMHDVIHRATESLTDGTEDVTEADHDRWEDDPVPTMPCRGCLHEETSMFDEPCLSCIQTSEWEKKR